MKYSSQFKYFHSRKRIFKSHLQKWQPSCLGPNAITTQIHSMKRSSLLLATRQATSHYPNHYWLKSMATWHCDWQYYRMINSYRYFTLNFRIWSLRGWSENAFITDYEYRHTMAMMALYQTIYTAREWSEVVSIALLFLACGVNSLGPSDTIWRGRSWSTMVQVMACCLMAPSHYLNQCWLIISKVLWHSSEDIIIRRSEDTNQ